jgi:hypothetical protein
MGDIAGFLLDNALKVGETVLKAVAPEINKAIEASNDLISSHTLDLAKALDLSGAFIPGNPLAFSPALKLAKSLASVIPGSEDKGVIDTIGEESSPLPLRYPLLTNPHAQSGWTNRSPLSRSVPRMRCSRWMPL